MTNTVLSRAALVLQKLPQHDLFLSGRRNVYTQKVSCNSMYFSELQIKYDILIELFIDRVLRNTSSHYGNEAMPAKLTPHLKDSEKSLQC